MKKLLFILLGFIVVLGLAGCNNDPSDIDVNLDEFVGVPTNLSISGTILSWDAVENADGYTVYVNGDDDHNVNTNSFNFGSISGDRLIFQVRTRAPRGLQDSALSASIAYMANRSSEIAGVESALATLGFEVPDGFADEMVDKGMLASEAQDLFDAMEQFMEDMDNDDMSPDDVYTALNDLLAEVDNVEAFVSAVVKVLLPAMLPSMEEDNEMYADLMDEIEDNPDQIVLAITSTIDYFISIEEMISQDLIDTLSSISEADSPDDLNASEINLVKEEMVNILRETMPTMEDMMLMFNVYDILLTAAGSVIEITNSVENYQEKMSAQMLYSIEAYINFLDTMDEDYFTDVIDFIGSEDGPEAGIVEVFILSVKYFAEFKTDNQDLLDMISEVFTDAEKELMFNDYVDGITEAELMGPAESIGLFLSELNFQDMLDFEDSMGNVFDAVLDAFVVTDGEFLRLAYVAGSYEYNYDYDYETDTEIETYTNTAKNTNYSSNEEYNYNQRYDSLRFGAELATFIDLVISGINYEDYVSVVTTLSGIVGMYVETMFNTLSSIQMTASTVFDYSQILMDAMDMFMTNSGEDQFDLIKTVVSFIVDEDIFGELLVNAQNEYQYFVGEYGAAFYSEDDYYYDEYEDYANVIYQADIYDRFMTSGNRSDIEGIISDFLDVLASEDLTEETGITSVKVTQMESAISDLFDFVDDNVGDIKNIDPADMSTADYTAIDDFTSDGDDYFQAIFSVLE